MQLASLPPARLQVLEFELLAVRPLRLVDDHDLAAAGRQREKELEAEIARLRAPSSQLSTLSSQLPPPPPPAFARAG